MFRVALIPLCCVAVRSLLLPFLQGYVSYEWIDRKGDDPFFLDGAAIVRPLLPPLCR